MCVCTELTDDGLGVALVVGRHGELADEDHAAVGSGPQRRRVTLAVDEKRVGEIQESHHGRHGVVHWSRFDGALDVARSLRGLGGRLGGRTLLRAARACLWRPVDKRVVVVLRMHPFISVTEENTRQNF